MIADVSSVMSLLEKVSDKDRLCREAFPCSLFCNEHYEWLVFFWCRNCLSYVTPYVLHCVLHFTSYNIPFFSFLNCLLCVTPHVLHFTSYNAPFTFLNCLLCVNTTSTALYLRYLFLYLLLYIGPHVLHCTLCTCFCILHRVLHSLYSERRSGFADHWSNGQPVGSKHRERADLGPRPRHVHVEQTGIVLR